MSKTNVFAPKEHAIEPGRLKKNHALDVAGAACAQFVSKVRQINLAMSHNLTIILLDVHKRLNLLSSHRLITA